MRKLILIGLIILIIAVLLVIFIFFFKETDISQTNLTDSNSKNATANSSIDVLEQFVLHDIEGFKLFNASEASSDSQNPLVFRGERAILYKTAFGTFLDKFEVNGFLLIGYTPLDYSPSNIIPTEGNSNVIPPSVGVTVIDVEEIDQSIVDDLISYCIQYYKETYRLYRKDNYLFLFNYNYGAIPLDKLSNIYKETFSLEEIPIEFHGENTHIIEHINTDITTSFESITSPHICSNANDCSINQICQKCKGSKFIFQRFQDRPGFTRATVNKGLCTSPQLHLSARAADTLYTGQSLFSGEAFCLIPFEHQEVPTVYPEESKQYLPLWKEKLIQNLATSTQYYEDHFYVHSTDIKETDYLGRIFTVNYFFKIDWLTTLQSDTATVKTTTDGFLEDSEIQNNFEIKFNHQINAIISKEAMYQKFKECLGKEFEGTIDSKQNIFIGDLRFSPPGTLTVKKILEVDLENNACKSVVINLENGEILSCQQQGCGSS